MAHRNVFVYTTGSLERSCYWQVVQQNVANDVAIFILVENGKKEENFSGSSSHLEEHCCIKPKSHN